MLPECFDVTENNSVPFIEAFFAALELIHDTRDIPYTYKGETIGIAAVTGDFCSDCAESVLDASESSRVMLEMRAFSKQVNAAKGVLPRSTVQSSVTLH